jgi:hypothetical protein
MAKVYARHINGSSAAPGQSVPAFGSLVASAIRQCNEVPLRRCGHGPRVRTRSFNPSARPGPIFVNEPRQVELWPCGYVAECSAPECRRRATTILLYLDNQEQPDHQTEACDIHTRERSAELRVSDRRR